MPLPNVSVAIEGGNLGRVVTRPDGVAGIVLSGVAVSGKLVLNTAYSVFSLREAEVNLGITAAYDTTNTTRAWRHIRDFYEQAGTGAELWIVVAAKTETLTQNVARITVLKTASEKRLRLVGVTRVPASGYTPTIANGWDNDCDAAVAAAKTLANDMSNEFAPCHILIEGREIGSAYASLATQHAAAAGSRYVSSVVGDYETGTGSYVGLVLGRLAAIPVQRSIARVRDGNINKLRAFVGTTDVATLSDTALGTLHDKGVIFSRKFPNQSGWYFNGDENSDAADSDFASISRARVVEKARLIAYGAMLQYLNDEIDVDTATGKLAPAIVADMQAAANTALSQMETAGNVSSAELSINPAQNVLSTDKVTATLTIVPKGIAKSIEVTVAFSNPFNS
jgi:hypothetical protein